MLLREHRFKFVAGVDTHLFTIEEIVRGVAVWPHKFRLKIPASSSCEARTFYGKSCYEVVERPQSSWPMTQAGMSRQGISSHEPPP
jgi:hypothetical protein